MDFESDSCWLLLVELSSYLMMLECRLMVGRFRYLLLRLSSEFSFGRNYLENSIICSYIILLCRLELRTREYLSE